MKQFSLMLLVNSICISVFAGSNLTTMKSTAYKPTCYELANTAILSAIAETESNVIYNKCNHPVLVNLVTSIKAREQNNPCGGVYATATYLCTY